MVDPTPVRRCVCTNISFEALKASDIQSLREAMERYGCGTKCGACQDYINEMVRTGQTAFPVLCTPGTASVR